MSRSRPLPGWASLSSLAGWWYYRYHQKIQTSSLQKNALVNLRGKTMLLCIDIGNTNIKLGLFEGDRIRSRWRVATDRTRLADEYAVLLLNLLQTEGIQLKEISGC